MLTTEDIYKEAYKMTPEQLEDGNVIDFWVKGVLSETARKHWEPRWISVDERLPELYEKVLVCFGKINNTLIGRLLNSENGDIWVVFFSDGVSPCVGKDSETITHRMPLPPLPEIK